MRRRTIVARGERDGVSRPLDPGPDQFSRVCPGVAAIRATAEAGLQAPLGSCAVAQGGRLDLKEASTERLGMSASCASLKEERAVGWAGGDVT